MYGAISVRTLSCKIHVFPIAQRIKRFEKEYGTGRDSGGESLGREFPYFAKDL